MACQCFTVHTTNAVEQTHSPSNIELYALNTDAVKNTNGIGVKFNSEDLKLKLELSKNFIKTGMVAKFNPQDSKFYFKTGLNLSNKKLFAGDNSSARVNQVSAALATGYLLKDDLYAEVGLSNTKLNGKNIGDTYSIADETTKLGYIELAKRIKTEFGAVDASINAGKSFYEFKDNEKSYGLVLDYYPSVNTKFSASSQFERGNNISRLGIKHKHWFANYQRNTSQNTNKIELGLSFPLITTLILALIHHSKFYRTCQNSTVLKMWC